MELLFPRSSIFLRIDAASRLASRLRWMVAAVSCNLIVSFLGAGSFGTNIALLFVPAGGTGSSRWKNTCGVSIAAVAVAVALAFVGLFFVGTDVAFVALFIDSTCCFVVCDDTNSNESSSFLLLEFTTGTASASEKGLKTSSSPSKSTSSTFFSSIKLEDASISSIIINFFLESASTSITADAFADVFDVAVFGSRRSGVVVVVVVALKISIFFCLTVLLLLIVLFFSTVIPDILFFFDDDDEDGNDNDNNDCGGCAITASIISSTPIIRTCLIGVGGE